ncbi:four-carbon acid sugar kinase family protein [Leifsonia kafniensis]|uniref:Four-carbon acid sugar kinase family protein n=1 Tax=Leifsonia kafniensis TaxID=475957 RepID=A0ABP7KHL3_9MICO
MTEEEASHTDDGHARALIRGWRGARRLAVLDDDPTGSQSVHHVQVVTMLDDVELKAALQPESSIAFVLTNTRGLSQTDAVRLTALVVSKLLALDPQIDIVSRSDSTLRGHLLAEVEEISRLRGGYDGVILAPAFFEAGRFTADDVHFATVGGKAVPVGETEFARDATFGFRSSNLCEFIVEKSGGAIAANDVLSISLKTIRSGGPEAVRDVLMGATDGQFVVVNGTNYTDYETVVLGAQAAVDAGRTFLFRTGPSFVRALAGIEPQEPLRVGDFAALDRASGHGLVVVGSHVSQTSRQVGAARARRDLVEVEVSVPRVVAGDADYISERTDAVRNALAKSDALLFTSRDLVAGTDGRRSLDIARAVSSAISAIVAGSLSARPAWVVAKGGITSHDVAVRGLGIRRASVLGQMLPGQISVFDPISAPEGVVGMPYVVFAGNVGDDQTLADVIETLHAAQRVSA